MCSDNFHLRMVLFSLSKHFFYAMQWISILGNKIKGERELQSESKNLLHKEKMRWEEMRWERERRRQHREEGEELIKRRIKVWIAHGLEHFLSFSIVSLSISLSWSLLCHTLQFSPNSVWWIAAIDLCPLFWIHIKILACGQPPDSFLGLT